MRQIDTGGLSFSELRRRDKYYVDKSLLIKDILESNDSGVYLFTRPRRFGKTTNLTMLNAFFNMKYRDNIWFDDLEISNHHQFDVYKNAFPVINLNLKSSKSPDYSNFLEAMQSVVRNALKEHLPLLEYDGLFPDERKLFHDLFNSEASREQLKFSVHTISGALERLYGQKVIVLIDEYDRAVADSFGTDSHRPMMDFLGEFMNASIKNNDSLQMAVVTGVMQIAKESIFSDLNNVKVNNVFSEASDERFGFTEEEVADALSEYGHPDLIEEAKKWYDGYRFGKANVYNPFSIMNYISDGFRPMTYWSNSGGDSVFRWLLDRVGDSSFSSILSLISGGSVRTRIQPSLRYEKVNSKDVSLYSLMVMSGYLNAVHIEGDVYDVSIPNLEVQKMVDDLIEDLSPINDDLFLEFNRAVLDCNADAMSRILQDILLDGSYLNLNLENAYELILMTIMHAMTRRFEVKTEYEAGNGRTDIILKPRTEGTVPMIFELKRVRSEDDLDSGLDEAMKQIHSRRYHLGMSGKVVLVGMSFFGKIPKVRVEAISVRSVSD